MLIVLLEDDWRSRQITAEYLERQGLRVHGTGEAEDALAAVTGAGGAAILVADRAIGGAGPNGFAVAEQALRDHPALRVVYVSGTHLALRRRVPSERERVLHKPFAMSQLLAELRHLGA